MLVEGIQLSVISILLSNLSPIILLVILKKWFTNMDFDGVCTFICHQFPICSEQISIQVSPGIASHKGLYLCKKQNKTYTLQFQKHLFKKNS